MSTISLCPSFDELKLFGSSQATFEYSEKKLDLLKIDQIGNNKKFIKELKSKEFTINLLFIDKNDFKNMNLSFSILFKNDEPIKIEDFSNKNINQLSEEDEQKINDFKFWIYKTFNFKSSDN